jgi:hypothetical protein
MRKDEILAVLDAWKRRRGVASLHTPFKYFRGLTSKRDVEARAAEILRGSATRADDAAAYAKEAFATDSRARTRTSAYTRAFEASHPGARSLRAKARATGVPHDVLRKVYDKGVAAWRTGHRVGATPAQWGYARVHSFLALGCAAMSSDGSLLRAAAERMSPPQRRKLLSQRVRCPDAKLRTPHYRKFGMRRWIKSQRM